jgi:hypothetical protein
MKMLLFRGTFSTSKNSKHNGLICCCHVQSGDTSKVNSVVQNLSRLRNLVEEKVIIVPFSRLDEPWTSMNYSAAKSFLEEVSDHLPNSLFLRFRKKHSFDLNVPSGSFVGFLKI